MSDLLQDRYGTANPRRRTALVVLTSVLALVFLAWLAWAAWFHSDPAIEAELTSYEVIDARTVNIKLSTRFRDAEVDGSCLIRATAEDHTIVGEVNLTVDQIKDAAGNWIPITTLNRATTVEKVRCTER